MTLDYTKMFLIVTEEAVVKGHFTSVWTDCQCAHSAVLFVTSLPRPVSFLLKQAGAFLLDSATVFVSFFLNLWYNTPTY